jgi:hypothetical protein
VAKTIGFCIGVHPDFFDREMMGISRSKHVSSGGLMAFFTRKIDFFS